MPIERTDHYFHLSDRDLIGCVMAFDYVIGEDVCDQEQVELFKRMLLEAKRRRLQSPEHRAFVSGWLAQKIEQADA